MYCRQKHFGALGSRRAIACLIMIGLLTAARLPLLGTRPLIVPINENPALNTDFEVKVGEAIVAGRFMDWSQSRLDTSTTVSVDRFSQNVYSNTPLKKFGATIQSVKRTGLKSDWYYCGPEIRTQSELKYQLFGSVFGNVENLVRFCFSDENSDNRFDHVFLGGAKAPALQVARAIDPIPFHLLGLQPDEDRRELRLVLARIEPQSKSILLYARPYQDNKVFSYGSFSLYDPENGDESKQKEKSSFEYDELPVAMKDVLGYDLVIKSVD